MAIEIMDGGAVIASALLTIPRASGDVCAATAARGISAVSSSVSNTIRVVLDQPCDPANTQAHVSVSMVFGGTVPDKETLVDILPNEILVLLAPNARGCLVSLLVLAIRGPQLIGVNTIP